MKGFVKSGKLIGLLLCAGLVFAGCVGGGSSSEEGAVPPTGQNAIPMVLNPNAAGTDADPFLTIGDGDGMAASFLVDGESVQLVMGSTPCGGVGADLQCWVRLNNLSNNNRAMVNTWINITSCPGCAGALMDNSDRNGAVICGGPGLGDPSCVGSQNFAVSGLCYVEDGNYDVAAGAADPWNVSGCPTQNVLLDNEPRQFIHPDCGSQSVLWDFGGQAAKYKFYAGIVTGWIPWGNRSGDWDTTNRSSYYVMLTDLGENATFLPLTKVQKRWYKVGAYVRANILAGWSSGTDMATMAVGTDFAVNVAIELPDRVESYKMGDNWQFPAGGYEYLNQVSATLRYNPSVVMPGTSGAANEDYSSGALSICKNGCGVNYDSWEYWQTGLGNETGTAQGWVAVANRLLSTFYFTWNPTYANIYNTLLGGHVQNYNYYAPTNFGQKGVATWNVPVGGTLSFPYGANNLGSPYLLHPGPDPDPDIPLTMWYFTTVGTGGSQFLIDTYADWSWFQWIHTGTDLIPGGKLNDNLTYCWPAGSCSPAGSGTVIESGNEKTNYGISQSGEAANGYFVGATYVRGGVQMWGVHVCVQ